MAELFNTTINRSHEILVGMHHAGKLPAVEATRTARERVIANLIRRELNLVRSGLIPRCSTIEEIARFCRLSNETVRFILSKYLDAKKLSFRKRHVRSSASSCLISVSKNNNVREIVAYAKSQADNYRIDEGSGLASYEKMSKEFHVSRERVRQIITKYLPQDLPLWTALQYKSRTRK